MIAPLVEVNLMSKKKPQAQPAPEPDQPSSETVRLASDLLEKVREMCFHRRDERNRRLKVTPFLDAILRPIIDRMYEDFRKEQKGGG